MSRQKQLFGRLSLHMSCWYCEEKSDGILREIRQEVVKHNFATVNLNDTVNIMDGREEAIFAWLTVNFLTKKLKMKTKKEESADNALISSKATLDLGGASMQVVFEVSSTVKTPHHSRYIEEVDFYGTKIYLYQHSYLGYGIMQARKMYEKVHSKIDHCKTVSSGWNACYEAVKGILLIDAPCEVSPCSFSSAYQPKIPFDMDVVLFSFFYDRIMDAGLAKDSTVTLDDIYKAANDNCYSANAIAGTGQNEHYCFEITFIYAVLRDGVGLELNQKISLLKKVGQFETGWSLGAAINLLKEKKNSSFKK